jgi:hypothetical protein
MAQMVDEFQSKRLKLSESQQPTSQGSSDIQRPARPAGKFNFFLLISLYS